MEKKLVCACTYHVNIDHLWKALNNLMSVNNKPIITDNADLLNKVLCNSDKICIAGFCRECQEFKKLDQLSIENLHFSKKCMIDQVDCTGKIHTIKVNLFEQADCLHKGDKKKKIQVLKNNVTPKLFAAVLKEKLMIKLITLLIKQLQACQIRHTCLLPEEIISIHLTQEQAIVYPVVLLRKVDGILCEDFLTFISNSLTHDVPFVELCNTMIHTYYDKRAINIEIDTEFNNGCASQCKCMRAIQSFARRNVSSIWVYFETSHGKSKPDGLGGVVKGYASREVAITNTVI